MENEKFEKVKEAICAKTERLKEPLKIYLSYNEELEERVDKSDCPAYTFGLLLACIGKEIDYNLSILKEYTKIEIYWKEDEDNEPYKPFFEYDITDLYFEYEKIKL